MIKEQRRINDKLKEKIVEKREDCEKQSKMTQRIHALSL